MNDLATWLLEQIAQDEAYARDAADGFPDWADGVEETPDGENVYFTVGTEQSRPKAWKWEVDYFLALGGSADDNARAAHIARWDPARVLAECAAKKAIVERETTVGELPEWTPDCGGDWCLNVGALSHEPGVGAFANYWPDNTVSASVYVDGEGVAESGIVARASRSECQAFAEQWIRAHLADASPVLRLLAQPYRNRDGYDASWDVQ